MRSKISWVNKEMLLQIFRSVGWVSIVYFVALLFTLPLRLMMSYTEQNRLVYEPERLESLFEIDFMLQFGLLVVMPVLMSIFLFRFLHVRQATDLMHSLPVRREKIFHHYAASGAVLLSIPVITTGLLIFLVRFILNLDYLFSVGDVFYWMGTTLLFSVLIYTAGLFVCMMTGISAVQGVLTYIFLLFPPGILLLVFYNLEKQLYGFPMDYFMGINLDRISPITFAAMLIDKPITWENTLIFIILTIIFYGLALFFYKKRKSESASEAIAFYKLRAVFKYGTTFCFMLLGGAYFSVLEGGSYGWLLFGYAAGTIIGFFIAEIVLQKTWRVFTNLKGLFIYSGIIVVVLTTLQFLGFYENKIPEQSEVKNVILSDMPYAHTQNENYDFSFAPKAVSSPENIEAIIKLHRQIVADKESNLDDIDAYHPAFFLYELKNGQKIIRQYNINKEIYDDFYRPLEGNEEFKRATTEVFHLDPEKIVHVQISANGPLNKAVTLTKSTDFEEFIAALQEDILKESVEDSRYFSDKGSYIEIQYNEEYFSSLTLKPNYANAIAWLGEKDLLEQVSVMPEEVEEMKVARWDGGYYDEVDLDEFFENEEDILAVSDQEDISVLLNQSSISSTKGYVIQLKYRHVDYHEFFFIDEVHAPSFVKEHFQ